MPVWAAWQIAFLLFGAAGTGIAQAPPSPRIVPEAGEGIYEPWKMHHVNNQYLIANSLNPADVNGDGYPDFAVIDEALGGYGNLREGGAVNLDALPAGRLCELAPYVDLILFAQASMTRLAPRIEEATGRPVLTSPRLAIEYTKRVLDGLRAAADANSAGDRPA